MIIFNFKHNNERLLSEGGNNQIPLQFVIIPIQLDIS